MYENVNTAVRANAMPALPTLTVIPAPATDQQDVEERGRTRTRETR